MLMMVCAPDLLNANSRGVKRSRSPETHQDAASLGSAGDDGMSCSALCSCTQARPLPYPAPFALHGRVGRATEQTGAMLTESLRLQVKGNHENEEDL